MGLFWIFACFQNNLIYHVLKIRGVVPGGAGGAMASPDFSRLVKPISTRRDRLCPPHYYWHPGFSDLPTALNVVFLQFVFQISKTNIPNHYPELEIWISCLLLWAGNSNFKFRIVIWSIFVIQWTICRHNLG